MTVGHHFKLSRPLNNAERANMDRSGVCLSCHQEIPDQSLAVSFMHHTAQYVGMLPTTPVEHSALIHKLLLIAAWGQMGGFFIVVILLVGGIYWIARRRRVFPRNTRE